LLDVATLYLDYSKLRHNTKTFEAKRLTFKRFFGFVPADIVPEELSMKTILDVLTKIAKEVSNAAANKERKNLSAFWEFGKKYHGFPLANPFQQSERFPEKPEHHYVPPVEDFWKVYDSVDEDDKTMLITFLHTAGRRSEVLHLTWEDIDFGKRKIRLSTCKTKDGSRKRIWLTMTGALYDALVAHKLRHGRSEHIFSQKRTGGSYVDRSKFLRRVCKKLDIKPFGYHGIRGLSATVLAQACIPLPEIQHILRHAHMTTTERYIRALGVTGDMLSQAFDNMAAAPKVIPFKAAK
jgi:integrase